MSRGLGVFKILFEASIKEVTAVSLSIWPYGGSFSLSLSFPERLGCTDFKSSFPEVFERKSWTFLRIYVCRYSSWLLN
jgi:hypothetical protein